MGRLKDDQRLYIRSLGKVLRVTAVFTNVDAANVYMAATPGESCIAVYGDLILLARTNDEGGKIDEGY
jgi:hypothetical protein